MSFGFAGQRRPGGPGESGALVHVKRPRMDLVAVGDDARNKQLIQSVRTRACTRHVTVRLQYSLTNPTKRSPASVYLWHNTSSIVVLQLIFMPH